MGVVSKIKVNSTNYDLKDAFAREHLEWYGTCNSTNETLVKAVTCANFALITGCAIDVKFAYTNTADVEYLKLNVNSTGEKSIKYRSGNLPSADVLEANSVFRFIYDGTNYELVGYVVDDAIVIKGTIGSQGATVSSLPPTHRKGWAYNVITEGIYAGKKCNIGDMVVCIADGAIAVDSDWTVIRSTNNIPEIVVFELDDVTNTSGAYSHTTVNASAKADMQAISITADNSEAFNDVITVTFNDGSITLSCPSVSGTSKVSVSALAVGVDEALASAEYLELKTSKLDSTVFYGWRPTGNGTNNQILRSNGDGTTRWDNAASSSEIGEAVTDWLDDNVPTGTTVVIDKSLTVDSAAADAKTVGDKFADIDKYNLLQADNIFDTVQTYTYDSMTRKLTQITHTRDSVAIRTDTFSYSDTTITEVRELNTGETVTIVTNLTTLETTVTYAVE